MSTTNPRATLRDRLRDALQRLRYRILSALYRALVFLWLLVTGQIR